MKRILLATFFVAAFGLTAAAQSRSNRLTRPCVGSGTAASVAIDRAGAIALTPCSTKAVTTAGGVTSSSPTIGLGYATGAGGAVSQATDKTTAVTSNTVTTAITMQNTSLAAATIVSFTFTNSTIAATDTVIVTHASGGTGAAYTVNAFPASGSAVISVRNNTAGALGEALVLRVTVIKSVSN